MALRDFADRNTEFLEIDWGSTNHTATDKVSQLKDQGLRGRRESFAWVPRAAEINNAFDRPGPRGPDFQKILSQT